jgi:hypothetical protein
MTHATYDGFVQIKVAIPDFEVEAAIRIGTNPSLVVYRRTLTAKI